MYIYIIYVCSIRIYEDKGSVGGSSGLALPYNVPIRMPMSKGVEETRPCDRFPPPYVRAACMYSPLCIL